MKVYVLPADNYGCGHYRMIWPAKVLQQQGVDITILPPSQESGIQARTERLADGTERVVAVQIPEDTDVLVVQRPAHPLQVQIMAIARSNGIAVVVDMDDDMSRIHPGNIAFHTYRHSNKVTPLSWKWAMECCKTASLVTTSTAALLKTYAKHGRGVVIDNYVPEATLSFDSPVADGFGWAGTTLSHPTDLCILGTAAQKLTDEGYPFRIIGDGRDVARQLKLRSEPDCTGSVDLVDWVRTIGRTYGVGIIPLETSAFNTAKSRLKGIEHFASGVPWVASPRAEYRRLAREAGCGLLADTPKEWYSQVKLLLTDDALRKEQVEMGRQYMKTQTIQANAWRYLEAWTAALKFERGHA
jgi:hypothetical protein